MIYSSTDKHQWVFLWGGRSGGRQAVGEILIIDSIHVHSPTLLIWLTGNCQISIKTVFWEKGTLCSSKVAQSPSLSFPSLCPLMRATHFCRFLLYSEVTICIIPCEVYSSVLFGLGFSFFCCWSRIGLQQCHRCLWFFGLCKIVLLLNETLIKQSTKQNKVPQHHFFYIFF